MTDQLTAPGSTASGGGATHTRDVLYVANTYGSDIWVLELPGHEHVRTIEVGGHPDEIKLPSDHSTLYVPRRDKDDLVAIDAITGEHLWQVPLAGSPHHITLTPDDRFIYTPIFNQTYVEIIDVVERRVVDRVEVGFGGHGSLVNADGTRVYVGTMVADQLCAIDTATHEVVHTYLFPEAVRPFDLSRDESRLYVQTSKLHGFYVLDVATGVVLDKVMLPLPPGGSPVLALEFPHTVNHGLALTPDGHFIMAAASLDQFVAVFTVPEYDLVATIPVGAEPNWIIFNAEGTVAYVSNRASDEVSVISVGEWVELERLQVGTYPQRLAVGRLPVSNGG